MGGHALSFPTVRLNSSDYLNLKKEIISKFTRNGITILAPPSYINKKSHGDVDLISNIDPYKKDLIQKLFAPKEIFVNDNVYSFDYQDFQVDLICRTPDELLTAYFYFSYNDLHNLIGRIAHKFGLKHSSAGLLYVLRDEGYFYGNITVSKDPHKILEFLGYNYDSYLKGFNELEDIFNYVISSPYFNSDIFKIENLNHINATRNRKRPVYMQFVKYIENKEFKNYIFPSKEESLSRINEFFPESNLTNKIEELKEARAKQVELHSKFNGSLVIEWIPQIKGKKYLGEVLREFKLVYSNEKIETNSIEKIKIDFIRWFNYYNEGTPVGE